MMTNYLQINVGKKHDNNNDIRIKKNNKQIFYINKL